MKREVGHRGDDKHRVFGNRRICRTCSSIARDSPWPRPDGSSDLPLHGDLRTDRRILRAVGRARRSKSGASRNRRDDVRFCTIHETPRNAR